MMPPPEVLVSSPFPIDSLQGNSVSARRIANRISALDLRAESTTGLGDQAPDVFIALHARRSLKAMREFRARFPKRPLVLVATGSDLYKDLPSGDPDVLAGMELADVIVTYQEASMNDIPEAFQEKTRTIWKSSELPIPENLRPPPRQPITFTILAHLREIKDPFLAPAALEKIPKSAPIQIRHFGAPLVADLKSTTDQWMKREPRYQWADALGRDQVANIIHSSHATINTGRAEGGSNAICESILLCVPVIATETPANVGFLGADYSGYFPVGDADSLAVLLTRCIDDHDFLPHLTGEIKTRTPLFTPESESAGWHQLLSELGSIEH